MVQPLGTPLWITIWQFLTKRNILLSSDSAIKILAIYPSLYLHTHTHTYTHTHVHTQKKNCTGMLMAILF